ncbi:transposase [Paracoccus acridae]|uniref:transposase n=1 Tax=Paracoccus TaxID=265 RepID=UPI001960BFA4
MLTDAEWAMIEPCCSGNRAVSGRSGCHNRLFIEAVLWIARTGSPRQDLPGRLGDVRTIFWRFIDRRKAHVFKWIR